MSALRSFFRPSSVALIGAAGSERKLGGVILKNLLSFPGEVCPVNPKYSELMGKKCYPSPAGLPPVDLAVIMRPAAEVPGIIRELRGKARSAIIMSAGFAETGAARLQEETRAAAEGSGIRFLGPNCMGIFNPGDRFDALFLSRDRLKRPKRGTIAVVSQSGAILSCLLSAVRDSGAGISAAVGYGNAADITESDLYEYFRTDRRTHAVVSYLESVGEGRRFLEAAGRLVSTKPVIVLKAGKGMSGQRAAFSHTGRLAGKYEVFRSLIRKTGVTEAADFDELMDGVRALAFQKPSSGNRVCIITNGGGSGVLAADECLRQGLAVTPLTEKQLSGLGSLFPPFYGLSNPVDLTAQVQNEDYATVMRSLAEAFDGFLLIAIPNVYGITERLAALVREARAAVNKPVVVHVASGVIAARLSRLLVRSRIPVYPSPERAARGLRFLLQGSRMS